MSAVQVNKSDATCCPSESKVTQINCINGAIPMDCLECTEFRNELTDLSFSGCSYENLVEFIKLTPDVQHIDISQSNYRKLTQFNTKLNKIVQFNASYNYFAEIPGGFFGDIPNVAVIDFSYNELSSIVGCDGVTKLANINLSHNKISAIDEHAFANLPKLLILDLSHNLLFQMFTGDIMTNFLFHVLNVKSLNLENNNISLSLNSKRKNKQSDTASSDTQLASQIWAADRAPPISSAGMTSSNELFMPIVIRFLSSSLEFLYCSENYVGPINVMTFKHLPNLKEIHLRKTHLMIVNDDPFEGLRMLQVLDISYNNLENLNFTVVTETLTNLRKFFAVGCRIRNAAQIFPLFGPALNTLDLSENSIGDVDLSTFKAINSLQYLSLANASLSNFDIGQDRMPSLISLNISNNNLSQMNMYWLSDELITLDLANNELTELDLDPVKFPKLSKLSLSGNQFSCAYLDTFMEEVIKNWPNLMFIGDPLDQKHGEDCRPKQLDPTEQTNLSKPGESSNMILLIGIIAVLPIGGAMILSSFILRKRSLKKEPFTGKSHVFTTIKSIPEFNAFKWQEVAPPYVRFDSTRMQDLHIYEEIGPPSTPSAPPLTPPQENIYDKLTFLPLPLLKIPNHYDNFNLLKQESRTSNTESNSH